MEERYLVCSACKQSKPETDFHLDLRSTRGRRSRCKPCKNAYSREHYRRSDHVKNYMKEWRSNNKKKVKKYNKKYKENKRLICQTE